MQPNLHGAAPGKRVLILPAQTLARSPIGQCRLRFPADATDIARPITQQSRASSATAERSDVPVVDATIWHDDDFRLRGH